MDDPQIYCDFCGKERREVRKLIATAHQRIFICDECVVLCVDILKAEGVHLIGHRPMTAGDIGVQG